jgi:hypothetical protein
MIENQGFIVFRILNIIVIIFVIAFALLMF